MTNPQDIKAAPDLWRIAASLERSANWLLHGIRGGAKSAPHASAPDMLAAAAALRAVQEPVAPGDMYLRLCDAMGYDSGVDGLEYSPEEYAAMLRRRAAWKPSFDVMSPTQEELSRQFCAEIAGPRGKPGSPPDPVRLLEVAQALYQAERDECGPDSSDAPAPPPPGAATDQILVTKHDANNYCRILSALGMEEEGDPVAWVERMLEATSPAPGAASPGVPSPPPYKYSWPGDPSPD